MPENRGRRWIIIAALLFLLAALLGGNLWHYSRTPLITGVSRAPVIIYIPPGASFKQIQHILSRAGLIEPDRRFLILARLTGAVGRLRAGEYRLPGRISPLDLLRRLRQGKTLRHFLTIPEGANIFQAARLIADSGLADERQALTLFHDPDFIHSLGLNESSLEGYLFPDTYSFKRGMTARSVIGRMVKRMTVEFSEECRQQSSNDRVIIDCDLLKVSSPADSPAKGYLHLKAREALILASIVEKETAAPEERPVIAQVFINRLRKGMRLQTDPTVIYGLKKFHSPLTKVDLRTPTPYNTYILPALPQGPICNPGAAALRAVMRPTPGHYYYFVSRHNGRHSFSTTLKEHNRAVRKYRDYKVSAP